MVIVLISRLIIIIDFYIANVVYNLNVGLKLKLVLFILFNINWIRDALLVEINIIIIKKLLALAVWMPVINVRVVLKNSFLNISLLLHNIIMVIVVLEVIYLVIIDVFILTIIAVVLEVKASIWRWLVIIILLFAERHFSFLLFLDGLFV